MSSLSDTRPQRIAAIDALRGFDMFFLTGGLALVVAGINLFYDRSPEWLVKHSTHVAWEGFAAWDLVMPLFFIYCGNGHAVFLFQAHRFGTPVEDLPESCQAGSGAFLLGMVVQGNLLSFEPSKMSLYCNTLQAIASGYLIAAICLLHLSVRWQVAATGGLLAVYWLVMKFVSFSDPAVGSCAAGMLEPGRNLALLLDKYLMGNWQDGTNYAWILAQFGFGAMTMLGLLGGQILKRVQGHGKKAGVAVMFGRGLPGAGVCLEPGFPDNQAFVHQFHGVVGGGMVLFAAGPVLPADGCAEIELADILFLRNREQCHFRVHMGISVPPYEQFLPGIVYRV